MRSSAKRFACASSSPPSTSSSTEQPCAHSLGLGIDEISRSLCCECGATSGDHAGGARAGGAPGRSATAESPTPKHVALSWARRLKRVFGIEIEQCVRCGGRLKVIASIEEPELIERILAHRRERGEEDAPTCSLGARAPPQASLF